MGPVAIDLFCSLIFALSITEIIAACAKLMHAHFRANHFGTIHAYGGNIWRENVHSLHSGISVTDIGYELTN